DGVALELLPELLLAQEQRRIAEPPARDPDALGLARRRHRFVCRKCHLILRADNADLAIALTRPIDDLPESLEYVTVQDGCCVTVARRLRIWTILEAGGEAPLGDPVGPLRQQCKRHVPLILTVPLRPSLVRNRHVHVERLALAGAQDAR